MSFNPDLCEGCPIQGVYLPLGARGPEDARFLIVTDVPSMKSAEEDRLMTNHQSKMLSGKLIDIGFGKGDFRFTPTCHCAYDPNAHVQKIKTAAMKHCRQHFQAEVESHDYEAIIPLGAAAASQVFGKATKITKVRGFVSQSEELGCAVFPMMSPGVVVMYPQNAPVFDADVQSFSRSVDAEYDVAAAASQQKGEYELIDDLEFLIEEDAELLSFDTETTGLRWYQEGADVRSYRPALHKGKSTFKPKFQILTMQFTTAAGKGYMLVWDHPENPIPEGKKPKLRNQLRRLLCKPDRVVVGQNPKFDNVGLWMAEGIRFRIGGDTLMMAALLDENLPEKNLDVLTKIYVPEMGGYADVFNATYDKSRMWEVPIAEMCGYGCGDTDAAFRLYSRLESDIMADDYLWAHYCNITIPGLNAFAALETRGMYIDEGTALANFKQTMIEEVAQQKSDLLRQIPRDLKQAIVVDFLNKPANKKKTPEDALSFTRTEFTKQVLFTHPRGFRLKPKVFTDSTKNLHDETLREPSVSSKDHLPYFFDHEPFTVQLAQYVQDESLLTKSVISFEKKYIRGGKVRPNYHLHKAVTGRSSSDDPNGQNFPKRGKKAKAYREMFVAPPGYYAIEVDLSQAELRIAACMSGDKAMIEIYRIGGDIHRATAAIVAGLTVEQFNLLPKDKQKEYRQKAKAVNFGFIYGMGWRKFIGYAKTDYGVTFTEKDAQRIRSNFFTKYRSLEPWHKAMRGFAQKNKFVRSFSGRIRHLPMIDSPEEFIQQEAGRQSINAPVQEFGSSLGVMAQGRMNEELDPEAMQIVGFVHDSIIAYVKKEYVDWGMKTLKRYMETNPLHERFGLTLKVPIVADVGFGENLGAVHECDGFTLDKPFNFAGLTDKDGNPLIQVPRQKTPPNNGRLQRSAYTTPEDTEDESVHVAVRRYRLMRAGTNRQVEKRIERSLKQMVINRRNKIVKVAEEKRARSAHIMRRARPPV